MLKLKSIVKNYFVGDMTVQALKGVSFEFRKSEFVAILGPSGCGKTTLLNIIGGLDRYTNGDMVINGVSTKNYQDRDWDRYRNNTIGFVFQSYNLIPHQSVLGNVELALTLSGVSKSERQKRATEALEKVGLGDQIHKRPNQLSGGQMQRVAIARAIVNNPDIILADEPTGALDTQTSIQVMNILKEIAKEKLVIMVTHNPELANIYATRTIKLLDGETLDDTDPYVSQEKPVEIHREKKVSMSFFTALSLSFRNLITKKARTILTSFAGSIGIIGIALILSLSSGFQSYISTVERDTLSYYPIVISQTDTDIRSVLETMNDVDSVGSFPDEEEVTSQAILAQLLIALSSGTHQNDLSALKAYIDTPANRQELEQYTSAIQYVYDIDFNIFKQNDAGYQQIMPASNEGVDPTLIYILDQMSQMLSSIIIWEELLTQQNLMESQYDLLKGEWPTSANDIVVIVDQYNQISDYTLYSLGLLDINDLLTAMSTGVAPKYSISFDEILDLNYQLVYQSDLYRSAPTADNPYYYENILGDKTAMAPIIENKSVELNVSGIIRVKEGTKASVMSGTIGYSHLLTKQIIDHNNISEVVTTQLAHQDVNVLDPLGQFTSMTLKNVLAEIGKADLADPYAIKLYPLSFEAKEDIAKFITNYNQSRDKQYEIRYTDMLGVMMSSISVIINAITYVLIAFVSISLVVSSIMIGIITYISVLERTKEIGVLRSIGASKKDISRVFNAETLIIGFIAGSLGIGITLLLNIPVNAIINLFADLGTVAVLPWQGGVVLIVISMILTLFAGLLPSAIAAKKDPVVALRTE